MLAPHPPGGTHHRGYSAPGVEKVSQHTYDKEEIAKMREIPDFKESFESGNPTDTMQPNIWLPEEKLPGFRAFMESYFSACTTLVHAILSALSLALSLPPPGLPATHAASLFQLRLLHYPPMAVSEMRNHARVRINAHSDFGTLTLLWQDVVGGLEVQDPVSKEVWRRADPVAGAVLVNIGDLLERWSNGRWRSCVHRVGAPASVALRKGEGERESEGDGEADGKKNTNDDMLVPERYSIPFFATADMHTLIDALPGCWDEADPKTKIYQPVTAWEYVQMRMAALY